MKRVHDMMCLGCGAPLDPKASECKYCRRPTFFGRAKKVILLVGGGIAIGAMLALTIRCHVSLSLGGKRDGDSDSKR